MRITSDLLATRGRYKHPATGTRFHYGCAIICSVGYLIATSEALLFRDLTSGCIQSVVFGMAITAVGCHEGFATGAGAEEVGRSTTRAVVISLLLLVLIDLLFTILFYAARGVR